MDRRKQYGERGGFLHEAVGGPGVALLETLGGDFLHCVAQELQAGAEAVGRHHDALYGGAVQLLVLGQVSWARRAIPGK